MYPLTRFVLSFFIATSILVVDHAYARELEDYEWIEVRTKNFHIRSRQNEKKTIELARYLEMFRVAVATMTNVGEVQSPIPTEIYALKSQSDFKEIGIGSNIAGIFRSGVRSNNIVIRNTAGARETSIIMHEYAHFLARSHGQFQYPRWFNEGFAEYLSGARALSKNFEIGLYPEHRASSFAYLDWIPMRKIIAAEDLDDWNPRRVSMFYAESWALVHYLLNRRDKESHFSQDMARYLQAIDSGEEWVSAFESAFGATPGRLDNEVRHYVERGRFPIYVFKIDELLPNFAPEVASLTREEVSLELGQIAFDLGNSDAAEKWFEIASEDNEHRAAALAGLGRIRTKSGDFDAARTLIEESIQLAPNDPHMHIDLADHWHHRARDTQHPDTRELYFKKSRNSYVSAWKLDDSLPEVYAKYGESFVSEGREFDKAIEMLEEAAIMLPSNIQIRATLAEAYLGIGEKHNADRMARAVLAWSHGDSDTAETARRVLGLVTTSADNESQ